MKTFIQPGAPELWDALKQLQTDTNAVLMVIIQKKLWQPYKSFTAAYRDHLRPYSLDDKVMAEAVYQMIREGAKNKDIVDIVRGVSVKTATLLRRQYSQGIPPSEAQIKDAQRRKAARVTAYVDQTTKLEWDEARTTSGLSMRLMIIIGVQMVSDLILYGKFSPATQVRMSALKATSKKKR